jgi:hypothetical protein
MAGMLTNARRRVMIVVAALGALFSVACAGGDDHPSYAGDAELTTLESPAPVASTCEAGAVRTCTIWLGATGDLANCTKGVEICADSSWSECIDEETIAQNPELYAALAGDIEAAP